MNENDLKFFMDVMWANRYGQTPVSPAKGFTDAAIRLERAGLLVSNAGRYIPTPLGEAKLAGLIHVLAWQPAPVADVHIAARRKQWTRSSPR